ncbi:MAG: HEAT repeat domain-containing protein [Gammaproteobacteria bacterium]
MLKVQLLNNLKTSRAIATLLAEQSVTSAEGKQALQSLRRIGSPAIPKLIEALSVSENAGIIESLLIALLNKNSLPYYLPALRSSNQKILRSITKILRKSEDYNPNELINLFLDQDTSKTALGEILASRADDINFNELITILDKVSSTSRPIIYRLIDQFAGADSIPLLVAKTKSNEAMVRTFIASALSRFNTKETRNTLTHLLSDPNKNVREAALRALGRLKAFDTVEIICQLLMDPDLTVQSTAIETLVEINAPETFKYLIEVLQDESEYVRRAAVEVLNEIGDQRAIKDLLTALRDADWWVKVRAADALGTIGGPKVIDAVLVLIKDEDEFLRRTAVEILNTSKDLKAYDKLVEALEDEDWWVRERAVDALAALGDKRAVTPLIKMLEKTPEAALVIIKALAGLGDKKAIMPILKQLKFSDESICKEALGALKILTDREHALDVQTAITELAKIDNKDVRAMATETIKTLGERFGADPQAIESLLIDFEEQNTVQTDYKTDSRPSDKRRTSGMSQIFMIDAALLQPDDTFTERYRVIKQVGKGAFGVVVLVEDTVVKDQFILKFLSPHVASDENAIQRFTQELRYARKVTHENVIRIYDFITHGRNYAISMEYFPSHSLTYNIARYQKLDVPKGINILQQICDGMAAAQAVKVVHRDLKPGNILINKNGKVKIVDFGLAAAASKAGSRLTKTGILVGTPTYMAPEQVRGKTIDSRTDIYALGVIMYEMFTGSPPYTGEESVGIMFQHVEGNPIPPREINSEIPLELQNIILKAMAIDPANRFQSFLELKAALESFAEEKV